MTAQAWQQVLERVQAEARQLSPFKVALALVTAPFFALGFLAASLARVGWLLVAWALAASVEGWRHAGGFTGRKAEPQ